jgi:Zn finger protein HypA/HybF involved in hydrogenase expression
MNTQIFIEKSNKIWNNLYDYSSTCYFNANTKVKILCVIHGEFLQLPSNHYRYGCAKCRKPNERNELLKKEASEKFISKANLVHNNTYIYNNSIYVTAVIKLNVTCKLHGDFEISPNNHLRGRGCPKCGILLSDKAKFKPIEDYINKFKNLFGNKFGDYSAIEWNGASKNIRLVCKKHGQFNVLAYLHARGKECPICSSNFSKISIQWLKYLQVKNNIFIQNI